MGKLIENPKNSLIKQKKHIYVQIKILLGVLFSYLTTRGSHFVFVIFSKHFEALKNIF